jgi:hypothetical protein
MPSRGAPVAHYRRTAANGDYKTTDAFVASFASDHLQYPIKLGGSLEDAATAIAVMARARVPAGATGSADFTTRCPGKPPSRRHQKTRDRSPSAESDGRDHLLHPDRQRLRPRHHGEHSGEAAVTGHSNGLITTPGAPDFGTAGELPFPPSAAASRFSLAGPGGSAITRRQNNTSTATGYDQGDVPTPWRIPATHCSQRVWRRRTLQFVCGHQ